MNDDRSRANNQADRAQNQPGSDRKPYNDVADESTIISTSRNLPSSVLSGWGSTRFSEQSRIVIYVKNVERPIIINDPQDEMLIGRGEAVMSRLNLAPYKASTKGVSRVHAAFRRDYDQDALTLVDLKSTNGTYLNEEPLTPERAYPLRDGDTIRFGQLVVHIYFQ